ncbi:hypothetical protein [Micromonospora sp. NPDC002575]|uniref:hypothetical protein n=1 Tax=Micromonospora sp. NPDC002575 TaxID=3364222 RepID=UPI0036CC4323
MGTEYERRLHETIERTEAHESILTVASDRGGLADYLADAEAAIELITRVEEVSLPAALAQNFHRHSGLAFAWRAKRPYETIAGEFRLVHIAEALLAGVPTWLVGIAATEREKKLIEEFRVFDTQPTGGTGTCGALRLTEGPASPEIWYFDMTQGVVRLHISYSDYLDILLRTRGLYYWQYLFAEPSQAAEGMSVALPTLRSGIDFLAQAFPNEDLSDLRARLEERERATGQ